MNKLVPIKDLFKAVYGVNLELVNLEECKKSDADSIGLISRTERNNGLSAYVKKVDEYTPNPAHTISVAVSGSVLSSFYQEKEYYSGRDVYYLKPKESMSKEEMLFYAFCLRENKYKYNYGRAANRTLKDILVPSKESIPEWVYQLKPKPPKEAKVLSKQVAEVDTSSWKWFELQNIFTVKKGKRLTKADMIPGNVPFIGAIDKTNGYREFIGQDPIHKENTITVNYNGSVGEAFFQPKPFNASDDVNVLYPKFSLNPYVALFIATVIKMERYRFNYGRKWHMERMKMSEIKLPADKKGNPDYQFMENYIKSLPYSAVL